MFALLAVLAASPVELPTVAAMALPTAPAGRASITVSSSAVFIQPQGAAAPELLASLVDFDGGISWSQVELGPPSLEGRTVDPNVEYWVDLRIDRRTPIDLAISTLAASFKGGNQSALIVRDENREHAIELRAFDEDREYFVVHYTEEGFSVRSKTVKPTALGLSLRAFRRELADFLSARAAGRIQKVPRGEGWECAAAKPEQCWHPVVVIVPVGRMTWGDVAPALAVAAQLTRGVGVARATVTSR